VSAARAAAPDAELIGQINRFRAAHGVAALRADGRLTQGSFVHARWMMAANRFQHAGGGSGRDGFRRVGEVIALHPARTPRPGRALSAWERSPGHRALLLDRSFHSVGAGWAAGRLGGRSGTTWVARRGDAEPAWGK